MVDQFSEMDSWTSEEVALFKEDAKNRAPAKTRALALSVLAEDRGIFVAEGDSWFDYLPGTDIIDCLRKNHGYVIDNYARHGDTLENMIYGTDINRNFERSSPTIDKVLKQIGKLKPKVFLFSGGGNDIAGEEFESYLNHKDSQLPVLREQFVNDMINIVFRKYIEDLIAMVSKVSPQTHIVMHGYGHTAPTGKGVDLLVFSFAGPWLKPALAKKNISDGAEQRQAVFTVIDRYNEMLGALAQKHPKFHYVDLRDMLNPDRDWVNELHLRNSSYARVAQRIDGVIQSL